MKITTQETAAGLTTVALREEEALLVVEDRNGELERIDIFFKTHRINVYSNGTWEVGLFKMNGTPIETANPLTAVVMHFRDGAALRQGFKTPIPQEKAMAALSHLMADLGGELNLKPE